MKIPIWDINKNTSLKNNKKKKEKHSPDTPPSRQFTKDQRGCFKTILTQFFFAFFLLCISSITKTSNEGTKAENGI